MASVRRALALSFIERYLLLVLALGSNIVLARLLTPEQIGVFSVSLAVIGIAQALRDFGIGSYLIQEKSLDESQIGTAFGISLLLGGALFVAALLAAPAVAAFYAEPRMELTLRISALNFLLLPFSTISMALMRRAMLFKRLVYVGLSSALVGDSVSVGLALAGVGENSLALGAVATNLATGLAAWLARPERRFIAPQLTAWRRVLSFGGQSSLTGLITSASMDASDLVVAKVLGFEPVAIISRAQGLMSLFNRDLMGAVRNVALPAFAGAHRDGRSLQEPFARSVSIVTVVGWPFHALMSIYALEVVNLLYGPQWFEAASLVPLFCLAGAIAAVNALTPNLLIAVGRIDLVTRVELLMQPLRVALIVAAVLVFRSVEACALAFLTSAAISLPVFWWFKNRALNDHGAVIMGYLAKSAVVTAAVAVPAISHVAFFGFERDMPIALWQCVGTLIAGVFLGVWTLAIVRHPLTDEALFQRFLGPLVRRLPYSK